MPLVAGFPRPFAAAAVALLSGAAGACGLPEPPPPRPELIEKSRTQSYYAADGQLERVLRDANRDGRADTQLLYRHDGSLAAAEIDENLDGVVDRWEAFRIDGSLESVGVSRGARARPDIWERYEGSPQPVRRDYDENGDGRIDRSEILEGGRVVREELDTDADGRMDRRLARDPEGRITTIEVERAGSWERRPVRRP